VSTTADKRATTDRSESAGPDATALLADYLRHVDDEDVEGRPDIDLRGMVDSHLRLAGLRPQGRAVVSVGTPSRDPDGWEAQGRTVIEIVTDDMPFLVDSVTAAMSSLGLVIDLVVHPIFSVRRDLTGALLDVGASDPGAGQVDAESLPESWMHVEVERISDPARLDEVRSHLLDVLDDVRAAVEDWPRMRQQALDIVEELRTAPPSFTPAPGGGSTGALSAVDELREGIDLLQWLTEDHFTFLGYREYVLEERPSEHGGEPDLALRAVPGTGYGFLRYDQAGAGSARLPPAVHAKAREPRLMIVTKANSRSTVHRPAYLDYISVKVFDEHGTVVGERRFLGLFTSTAYTESITRIPMLHRKSLKVLERLGYSPDSHSGKALLDICETYPRDELFQTSVEALAQTASAVLRLQERRRVRLFVRPDDYGRFLSCLVYLPRDRYTTPVRLRMEAILASAVGGAASVDYSARVTESVLARLHFVVRPPKTASTQAAPQSLIDLDVAALERRLADAARSWVDGLVRAAHEALGEQEATRLLATYGESFPEAYKEDFGPQTAITDLALLQQVDPGIGIGLTLWSPGDAAAGEFRAKVYRFGSPVSLSHLLPIFTALGVDVLDERPYGLVTADGPAWIYDIGLRARDTAHQAGIDGSSEEQVTLFADTFLATWRGLSEADQFNRLVVAGRMTWHQVVILRAYAAYLRQVGAPFSQRYIEDTLLANVSITRLLVQLFEAKFCPVLDASGPVLPADDSTRTARVERLEREIIAALDDVASLDQDRILRSYVALVRATVRTSFYQPAADGRQRAQVSMKLLPRQLADLAPAPRPAYEIFVYSPRVEGVHLRFGPVARGGLRWSDRREDFRTEVLGLVKAQMVKNTVIVPVGAKGGFYCKQLPDPSDREAWAAEGRACYRLFVSALLDLTDNRVDGAVVRPRDVVCHDGDDSYLVVAADKGTATFSDLANEVAAEHDFWLGDAFASGGSVGYDHKAMGITARGAWESVRRHFREMGVDVQREDHTAVGIGDMSGDVFGNGMLLSRHTRLIAAFDHRHIFLDPDPDTVTSGAERRRLFDLPGSSWADYNPDLISEGGGVWPRTAKSLRLGPQACRALGIDAAGIDADGGVTLAPQQVIQAILLAQVDLLWNGGIGTYVKASTETSADVGDKANDAIRVDGAQLRVRCVGEGGNLGLTQCGRIEYARHGGRINTDFIDNSAGVDTSDHEVNIKILLDRVVRQGDLDLAGRNTLLESMTDEVAALVLRDNDGQNRALANAIAVAPDLLHVHAQLIRRLESRGHLDRALEHLPSDEEIDELRARGEGLSAPELSVLFAFAKIAAADELIGTDLPEDPFLRGLLYSYFPTPMQHRLRAAMDAHPLRREIVVTQAVNNLVNSAGMTLPLRLSGEIGVRLDEIVRAHAVASEIFGASQLRRSINALDGEVDADVVTHMRLSVRTLVERSTRWLLEGRRSLDAEAEVDHFGPHVQRVVRSLPDVLVGRELEALTARASELVERGVPKEIAHQVASTPIAQLALGIVDTASATGCDVLEVARVHAVLSQRLELDRLAARIGGLPREDRWQTMARATLRGELYDVHTRLTAQVLALPPEADAEAADRVERWTGERSEVLARAMATLGEVLGDETSDLARTSVGLRVVQTLLL
jgi:glutamate dehydrogenase